MRSLFKWNAEMRRIKCVYTLAPAGEGQRMGHDDLDFNDTI
jgi:hypothetical protein